MDKMLFGSRSYKKLCKSTAYDWLCSIQEEVTKYMKDPYCGFLCTNSFYHDLIKLTIKASKKANMHKVNKELPLFIFSGAEDPVGGYGKDVNRLVQFYTSNGYNVTSTLYPNCRHEIILDTQKQNVMNDILDFLTTTMNEPSTYKSK